MSVIRFEFGIQKPDSRFEKGSKQTDYRQAGRIESNKMAIIINGLCFTNN